MNRVPRLVLLAVVVGCAVGVSTYIRRGRVGPSKSAERPDWEVRGEKWYNEALKKYVTYQYQPLSDVSAVEEVLRGYLDKYPQAALPQDAADALVRDLAVFLHARAAKSPDELLEQYAGLRTLRHDAYEDAAIHAWYRGILHRNLAADATPHEILDELWEAIDDSMGYPDVISATGLLKVARSARITKEDRYAMAGASANPLWARSQPPEFSDLREFPDWELFIAGFGRGCARVTDPPIRFVDAFEQDRALMFVLLTVLKTTTGVYFSVHSGGYYTPKNNHWNFLTFGDYHVEPAGRPF